MCAYNTESYHVQNIHCYIKSFINLYESVHNHARQNTQTPKLYILRFYSRSFSPLCCYLHLIYSLCIFKTITHNLLNYFAAFCVLVLNAKCVF